MYNFPGHIFEIIGFIFISIPINTILIASRNIKEINNAKHLPQEIKDEIINAEIRSAVWPGTFERRAIIFGFLVHLAGMIMIALSEYQL